jgi:hypothetical protein
MSNEPTSAYTVISGPTVTIRDVLDALTAGHEAVFYREAIARDGLANVAADELRDLIDAGLLYGTEDEASERADDITARDEFAAPLVLEVTADDIAEHLARLGWNEPEPRRLFDPDDLAAALREYDGDADALEGDLDRLLGEADS